MPRANINREFHFGEPTLQSLRDNDKAIILALAEIYSNKNLGLNCRNLNTTATADRTDVVLICDATGGAWTLTLPAANGGSSRDVLKTKLLIIKHSAGTNNITISAGTGDTVDGGASVTLRPTSQYMLYSDGSTKWLLLSPHYEEGTWTPTIAAGSGTFTTVSATGAYTKVGNRIMYRLSITITNNGTAGTYITATLPFTPAEQTAGVVKEVLLTGVANTGTVSTDGKLYIHRYDGGYPGLAGYVLECSGHYKV